MATGVRDLTPADFDQTVASGVTLLGLMITVLPAVVPKAFALPNFKIPALTVVTPV